MRVDQFQFDLPEHLIAQRPREPRDSSRLFVLHRDTGEFEHRHFRDLGDYLNPGDCLVLNDTKVVPARLYGVRSLTGGRWEGLFVRQVGDAWEMMTKTRGRIQPGEEVIVSGTEREVRFQLIERTPTGTWLVRPDDPQPPFEILEQLGHVPLPPYIRGGKDNDADHVNYQTVFAEKPGAVAAPTAGLHFTPELLDQMTKRGIHKETVTLHVGLGTFLPISVEETDDHLMHAEWCELTPTSAEAISQARVGHRCVAVGTTSVRVLESAVAHSPTGQLDPYCGETSLFIVPPYRFGAVDVLVTNFHLPKSTLLMLVCAFASTDRILAAYKEAIRREYRFYSYGDAMLIV